jgi:hypothetical protein
LPPAPEPPAPPDFDAPLPAPDAAALPALAPGTIEEDPKPFSDRMGETIPPCAPEPEVPPLPPDPPTPRLRVGAASWRALSSGIS